MIPFSAEPIVSSRTTLSSTTEPAGLTVSRAPRGSAADAHEALGRGAVGLLVLLAATLLAAFGCSSPATEAEGEAAAPRTREQLIGAAKDWNVVLISVDTLRADRLNSYGYTTRTTSPAMDGLIERGLRFDQASAPRGETWPSLATALTGLLPSGHGLVYNGDSFPNDLPTLPLLLDAVGYQTGAFYSNMCDSNHLGWDTNSCTSSQDQRLLAQAEEWLSQVTRDEPVLLWTHFFGAHGPYYNGGDLARQWDPDYDGIVAPRKGVLDRIQTEGLALDERDIQHLDAVYDAAVYGTDLRIARLLAMVEEHLDSEKTILVLIADHGEDLYRHNRYLYHSCSVYESSLRVPFAIVAPGLIEPGGVTGQPVELADLLPTLLDLLGVEPPTCQHGQSLLPYLVRPDRDGVGKPAVSEYGLAPIGTVRVGDWKLIANPTDHRQVCLPGTDEDFYPIGTAELYDLAADPDEQTDLASAEPTRVDELSSLRRERIARLCRPDVDLEQLDLSPERIKALEEMGYVVPSRN